jgi:putative heme iron utilization protein
MNVLNADDEELDVSHVYAVCNKSFHGRRGKYVLFMTNFGDDGTPQVCRR